MRIKLLAGASLTVVLVVAAATFAGIYGKSKPIDTQPLKAEKCCAAGSTCCPSDCCPGDCCAGNCCPGNCCPSDCCADDDCCWECIQCCIDMGCDPSCCFPAQTSVKTSKAKACSTVGCCK